MAGRDAFSASGHAVSQSPLRASSVSSSASASSRGSAAARKREPLALKEQLAAWRRDRDQQRQQEQAQPTTPTKKPTTPTKPKPFRASASNGPSDEEKQRILQKRRELMRSPMRPMPLPTKEEVSSARGPPPPSTPASSVASSTDSREHPVTPPPRTPPRRGAHQDVHGRSQPRPPQTPPLAPRSRSVSAIRSRLPLAQRRHGQRLSPPEADVTAEPERSPMSSLSRTSDYDQEIPPPTLDPIELPYDVVAPSPSHSPPHTSQPLSTTSQDVPHSEDDAASPTIDPLMDYGSLEMPSESPLPPPIFVSPSQLAEPVVEQDTSSISSPDRNVQASPRKQVRFVVQEKAHVDTEGDRLAPAEAQDAQSASKLNDSTLRSSDLEPRNPLTDSQSSFEREMRDHEQLMSEVDELIHHRTEDIVVTDHLLHRHIASDGHEEIDETLVTSHTEETSTTRIVEETVIDEPSPGFGAMAPLEVEDEKAVGSGTLKASSDSEDRDKAAAMDDESVDTAKNALEDDVNGPPSGGATLRVVKSRIADDANDGLSGLRPLPAASIASSTYHITRFRSALIVILLTIGLIAFDLLFPRSPVSRGLRVTKRVVLGLMSYLGSRSTVWVWRTLLRPGSRKVCELFVASNSWLEPRAKALQSLVNIGRGGFPAMIGRLDGLDLKALNDQFHPALEGIEKFRHSPGDVGFRAVKSIFNGVSSSIADAVLYVFGPLMRPLPTIDPESTLAAQDRLEQLTEAQFQLRLKVKDLLRTQEEWALEELDRMKQRRVAYATATKEILAETTKAMLKAVQEAKLSAAEHIQDFTNELAHELMTSIQPELEEYERLDADHSREQAHQKTTLEQVKFEEEARLEVLRVESIKRQAGSKLRDEIVNDRNTVEQDKIFVGVDVMEIVETVEKVVKEEVDVAAKTVADSFVDTVHEVKVIGETADVELEAVVQVVENLIQRAEKQFVEDAVVALTERERELTREHDAAQAEITRLSTEELKLLRNERMAAEELAQATVLAEEALINEAEEAYRALDVQLEAGKVQLEEEVVNAANVAVKVEEIVIERVVVEEEVVKEVIEAQIVDEVEQLVREVGQIEVEAAKEVEEIESELVELEEVAESTLDQLAAQEVKRLEREQAAAISKLDAVAAEAEREISANAGIVLPTNGISIGANTNGAGPVTTTANAASRSLRSIIEETERRHMMMLSIGFVVLGLVTAYVLYPRWRRLIANPTSGAKAMHASARRRHRRSWQRPAQVSDSEPEEVMLLQTGSSSDDGLSESNEPEPEVVEQMSGIDTPQTSFARSTRTSHSSYTSYSRALDLPRQDEQANEEDDEEEEELVTPPPSRRALQRRRR